MTCRARTPTARVLPSRPLLPIIVCCAQCATACALAQRFLIAENGCSYSPHVLPTEPSRVSVRRDPQRRMRGKLDSNLQIHTMSFFFGIRHGNLSSRGSSAQCLLLLLCVQDDGARTWSTRPKSA
ncbi:hypothetical protein P171DRAFT_268493 [Karstenula rhodostoma CBS 690.94]|uniref:Uncharacterized protein n=1 Tax=Karstenula rhodostoma CBS 690.94 TaxID=1392251 RepID=A0A9P4UDN7_9PLEO|nr:hypothetical protein P171DRAFT_268493 [Karstenula rhodostoma CBS 690.94]